MKDSFNLWLAITRLKDFLTEKQVREELTMLLRLLVSIISKLMEKETLSKRLNEVSDQILDYVYPDPAQLRSPADNVSDVD